jgi:hypothetical protein
METQDDLFELIKSLTVSEKRYFKLSASVQKGESNYIRLFDAIDKQEEYDERKIKEKFQSEVFAKQLHRTKNYLHNLILKCLVDYNASISVSAGLKDLLRRVEILFDKKLFKQCEKLIGKGKITASHYEKYHVVLELHRWELELHKAQRYAQTSETAIESLYQEIFALNAIHVKELEFEKLSASLSIRMSKRGLSRNYGELVEYKNLINEAVKGYKNKNLSYLAAINYYKSEAIYHILSHNYAKAIVYEEMILKLMEDHPHQIKEKFNSYVTSLSNLIVSQLYNKMYGAARKNLKKLKGLKSNSVFIRGRIFYLANNGQLNICIATGEFQEALELISSIEDELKKVIPTKFNGFGFLLYNVAHVYFVTGNYSKAKLYINMILNGPVVDYRIDAYGFAKLLSLLIHVELGNHELLKHAVKSTYRYLYKNKRLYKFENSVLHFIRTKSQLIPTEKKLIEAFRQLKVELEGITQDVFEAKALEYFDFISWLESKIGNRPFAEILQKKIALERETVKR